MLGFIKRQVIIGTHQYAGNKKTIHQTFMLFFSQLFILLIGFVGQSLQTRALGPINYGLYAFFGTITGFSVLFFRFGLFSSLRILLANNNDEQKEREYFAAGFLIAFMIGLLFTLFILAISFCVDTIFNVQFGHILRFVAPLCFILPCQFLMESLAVGSNKIVNNVIYNILSKLLFIIPLTILYFIKLTVLSIIILNLSSIIIAVFYILFRYKPLFSNLSGRFREIWIKNNEYGLYLYVGQIADQSTYKLDGLLITYFINTTELGFYSLANILCSPVVFLTSALSQSLFKKAAFSQAIPKKIQLYNMIWLVGSTAALPFISNLIVRLIFGVDFLPILAYIVPLAIAAFVRGWYQLPNMFLSVKGYGREMRNCSFIMMVANIIGNIVLIPLYGVMGAAVACIVSNVSFAVPCYIYYKRIAK